MSSRFLPILLFFIILLGKADVAFSQLTWTKPANLNDGLPPSIEVFATISTLAGNIPVKAWYMVADLDDPNIRLKVVDNGGTNKTPAQYIAQEPDPVFGWINGGFFSGNQNLSLVLRGGSVIAPNVKQVNRIFMGASTPYFPTRGAFGIDSINQPDVSWIYNVDALNTTYAYPNPSPIMAGAAPLPAPTDTFPTGAFLWNRREAIGGSPVLISNDSIRITDVEELIDVNNTGREPRTAIGYLPDGRVIFFVCEGRNSGVVDGLTLVEVAQIMKSIGCKEALNLDGGGSTAMLANGILTNRPADAGNPRPVPSAVMITRANQIIDTDMAAKYKEYGSGWGPTAQAGFFPPSQARICGISNTASFASYKFTGITPGRYDIGAWWPVAGNRATNTPYTLYRNGVADTVTVRFNQSISANANRFNSMGVFDISENDSIVVSTNSTTGTGAGPFFITTDALRLAKTGESFLQLSFVNGPNGEVIKDSTQSIGLQINSPNTGVTPFRLKVFVQIGANTPTLLIPDTLISTAYQQVYTLNYLANVPVGSVTFTFEVEDNYNRVVKATYNLQVVPLTQVIFLGASSGRHEFDRPLTFDYAVNSRRSNVTVTNIRVFRKIGVSSTETLISGPLAVNQFADTLTFSRNVDEPVNSEVFLRFEATDSNNESFSRTYSYKVLPKRGDFRMVVVSDLNSSFGSVSYEYQVDSIFQRIPRIWSPDLVVCGGDMVAGQSLTLDSTQVANMWSAFDTKVATPLRNANIPFAFTMGNHDASVGVIQDRLRSKEYWQAPGKFPGWHPVDTSNYPYYMSFTERDSGEVFIVSWDASNANIPAAQVAWTRAQLLSPQAQSARWRILIGHMPLYGVAAERDSPGNILSNAESLRQMMEEVNLTAYIAGHHHAYFPGKRGTVELLNAGAVGSGARQWLTLPEQSPNTATVLDFFDAEDTIVYTTFEIRTQNADAMQVFDENRLPDIIPGFNGYTLNRRVKVSGEATGQFSGLHLPVSSQTPAVGSINVVKSANNILLNGSFSNLKGMIAPSRTSVALFRGLHAEQGTMLKEMNVVSVDGKNGTFTGSLPATLENLELLSAGSMFIQIDTDSAVNGEVRAQLYKSLNVGPEPSMVTQPSPSAALFVRNNPGLQVVKWSTPKDPEANPITYTYQLSSDSTFNTVVYQQGTGRLSELRQPQSFWYGLLGSTADSVVVRFYHRIISSDGRSLVVGPAEIIELAKTNAPQSGAAEVEAPNFVYDCTQGLDVQDNCIGPFGVTPANNGQGISIDNDGKVWASAFSFGFRVYNPDGTPYTLTHPGVIYRNTSTPPYVDSLAIGSFRERVSSVTGMGRAHDGNILIAFSNRVYKLDKTTGQPLARLLVQTGGSLTNPESDSLGRIFVTTVTGNNSWLLTQNGQTFDTIRVTLAERPVGSITRASTFARNGREIYIPYLAVAGVSSIQKFTSTDGVNFSLASTFGAQGACKSIFTPESGVYYAAYDASGPLPSRIIFRDERDTAQILSWTYPMPSINGQDLRGLVFTMSRDTFYTTSTAVGRVERHFVQSAGSGSGSTPISSVPNYSIRDVRGVDASGRADSAGVYCKLQGVVTQSNFRSNGLDFTISQGDWGIHVFNSSNNLGYTPTLGNLIQVSGRIRQEYGLIRIAADTIQLVSTNQSIPTPRLFSEFVDSLESTPVRMDGVTLINPSDWTTGVGYHGFEVRVLSGSDTVDVFVPKASSVYLSSVPEGQIGIRGTGGQFSISAPFTNDRNIQPRSDNDLLYNKIMATLNSQYCEGDTLNIGHSSFGDFDQNNAFVYQLSDTMGMFSSALTVLDSVFATVDSARIVIPTLPGSAMYRLRVTSTQPSLSSLPTSTTVSIYPNPTAVITFDSLTGVLNASAGADSYQWFLAGVLLPGANAQSYAATSNGLYTVLVTKNGCSKLSASFLVAGSKLSTWMDKNVMIFPNPVSDQITLTINSNVEGFAVYTIRDVLGRAVKKSTFEAGGLPIVQILDVSDLMPGIYFIDVAFNDMQITKQIVKE